MKRRGILAGGAMGVGMVVTGVTTWLLTQESNGDEDGDQSTSESDQNKTSPGTSENETMPEARKEDVENQNQSEQPEAVNPEPDPQGPETNESAIKESAAESEPSASDVVISETELVTESKAATVSGTATNESNEPVTIELEVTFLEDGKQLGRPALNGTTGLPAGETWDFTVSGLGNEYSAATEYEIAKHVRTQG